MKNEFTIHTSLWRYSSENTSWFFVSVDQKTSTIITSLQEPRPGFNSVKARLKIGKTVWESSLFPNKKRACYDIPIKASVRKEEQLQEGDLISLTITLL